MNQPTTVIMFLAGIGAGFLISVACGTNGNSAKADDPPATDGAGACDCSYTPQNPLPVMICDPGSGNCADVDEYSGIYYLHAG